MYKPLVAVVGRPNVGKSTLFNAIVKKRISIVEDIPGVTRDRIYFDAEWLGQEFTMIDTGGIEFVDSDNHIFTSMRYQAELAIREADVILYVVDGKVGVQPQDEEIAHLLRSCGKPVILVVNKIDSVEQEMNIYEFYSLGLGDPIGVSAVNLMNLGDLLDEVLKYIKKVPAMDDDDEAIHIALVGRPNVGKSSLTNALLGQERVIVSNVPGTTRDSIDTHWSYEGTDFVLIDTAGMRRKAKIDMPVERYSVVRALRAVDRSDIAVLVIDATEGVTEQDTKIAGYVHEAGKGCIIVVNKWDAVEGKETNTMELQRRGYAECFSFMGYAPIIFISAQTGYNVNKLMQLIRDVDAQNGARVPTGVLNEMLARATARMQPPSDKGRRLKIFYLTQASTRPPTFVAFVNSKQLFHFSYQRYLINQIRENFGLEHTPIRLVIRERGTGSVGAKDV